MRAHGMNAILLGSLGWWDKLDRSKTWQDGIFDALSALYAIISIVALIQLIRIKLRLPEYGWTTQKVFHLLNFLVNGVRAAVFFFRRHIQSIKPRIFRSVLLDAPGLLFFSTYTLLVLFWAEIYFQARSIRTDGLRPSFLITNAVVYVIQFCIWIFFWWSPNPAVEIFSKIFFAGVSFIAAIGFLVYGGRLFLMLRRFPVDSKGRQKKLQEVGWVTAICFTCFLIRCLMVILSAFIREADINNLQKPIITAVYYLLVEIVPSALVLYILRKLPPTRTSGQFQSVR